MKRLNFFEAGTMLVKHISGEPVMGILNENRTISIDTTTSDLTMEELIPVWEKMGLTYKEVEK